MMSLRTMLCAALLAAAGCQNILGISDTEVGTLTDGGGDPDAPGVSDAGSDGSSQSCVSGNSQCDNCVDDDGDGTVDGFDVHCTTAADDDEASFSTGLPGDNIDSMSFDCFFDGDSGPGNDGCDDHPCCSLGAPDQTSCPINPGSYDPGNCGLSPMCIDTCNPVVIPGCDCLGCCTLCDEAGCRDIQVHPLASPDCVENFDDPNACLSCVKNASCETPCDPANCVLCPGQTVDDLPASCNGVNECPATSGGRCEFNSDCETGALCSWGCCIPAF